MNNGALHKGVFVRLSYLANKQSSEIINFRELRRSVATPGFPRAFVGARLASHEPAGLLRHAFNPRLAARQLRMRVRVRLRVARAFL